MAHGLGARARLDSRNHRWQSSRYCNISPAKGLSVLTDAPASSPNRGGVCLLSALQGRDKDGEPAMAKLVATQDR